MKRMITDTRTLVDALAEVLRDIPGVRLVLLFGSAARDALRADSDVDVAVLFSDDVPLTGDLLLEARLVRAVGREVDFIRLNTAGTVLRWEIARNHVLVLSEPGPTYVRFLANAALDHADMQPLLEETSQLLARRLARPNHGEQTSS